MAPAHVCLMCFLQVRMCVEGRGLFSSSSSATSARARFPLFTYAPPPLPLPSHPQILSRGCEGGPRSSCIVWWTLRMVCCSVEKGPHNHNETVLNPRLCLACLVVSCGAFLQSLLYLGGVAGDFLFTLRLPSLGEKEIK